MPVTTHTVTTLTEANANHVSDRRAASHKQDNSVTEAEWPIVTRSAYVALARGATAPDADASAEAKRLNLAQRRLCAVRNAASTLVLMIDAAMNSFNPQLAGNPTDEQSRRVYGRLRALHKQANVQLMRVPLEVR